MQQLVHSLTSKKVTDRIDQLAPAFKQLPHLPQGAVDFLVSVAPWLAALGGIFGVISGLGMISTGMGWSASLWMRLAGISPTYFLLSGVIELLMAGVSLLAFKPLQDKKEEGWVLLFWGMALSVVEALVSVVLGMGSGLIGMVIGLLIGLYILFEVRSAYTMKK